MDERLFIEAEMTQWQLHYQYGWQLMKSKNLYSLQAAQKIAVSFLGG